MNEEIINDILAQKVMLTLLVLRNNQHYSPARDGLVEVSFDYAENNDYYYSGKSNSGLVVLKLTNDSEPAVSYTEDKMLISKYKENVKEVYSLIKKRDYIYMFMHM